ncbi:uncharacterized protein LOC130591402 [Beta vulgaris subsp. vulgaris]|uniref:uncharacterized protein LOC130591402 n=1 Tax=Beta vulgaris subsp. vulgaris TaxID=3555 RepID=UPI002547DD65|nr:uncharacterized protein LOC130591402 [Beta vulgaris subsp. vulgaris]
MVESRKGIHVSSRVLLAFTIGKEYKKSCGVMYPMDAAMFYWEDLDVYRKEFILHSDHEALKYLQSKQKLQPRHAKWVEFLQAYHFVIKHKSGKMNKGADAFVKKEGYIDDPDFGEVFAKYQAHAHGDYHVYDGFLFKNKRLCVAKHSVRESLIREFHEGGLAGHFGIEKTYTLASDYFFWPRLMKDV